MENVCEWLCLKLVLVIFVKNFLLLKSVCTAIAVVSYLNQQVGFKKPITNSAKYNSQIAVLNYSKQQVGPASFLNPS